MELSDTSKNIFAGAAGIRHLVALVGMLLVIGVAWGANNAADQAGVKKDNEQDVRLARLEAATQELALNVRETKTIAKRTERTVDKVDEKLDKVLMGK